MYTDYVLMPTSLFCKVYAFEIYFLCEWKNLGKGIKIDMTSAPILSGSPISMHNEEQENIERTPISSVASE